MSVIRRHTESPEIPTFEPRLFVKVLKSVDEFEDALLRAALYERWAAQITGERAARYEALMRLSRTRETLKVKSATPLTTLEKDEADGRYQAA
jgi:hypothetical protein